MALSKKDLEEIVKSLKGELSTITTKLTKMESQLDTISAENKELKSMVADRDAEIFSLKIHINTLEQYNRSWSVRIMGLPLSPEEESNPDRVKTKIFENILRPILEGAAAAGDLPRFPPPPERSWKGPTFFVAKRAHLSQ
jgi:uncharacterized protein (DUF3084 family)